MPKHIKKLIKHIKENIIKIELSILILLGGSITISTIQAQTPLILGVGVHSISSSEDIQNSQLSLVRKIGLKSVRTDAPWSSVEKVKGHYLIPNAWDKFVNQALKKGIQPLLILDYGNTLYDNGGKPRSREAIAAYTRYASVVVNHFRGRVRYFEIWNEWDLATGNSPPASPEDYANLFKSTYPVLKKISPESTILIGAGGEEYLTRLAELGVVSMGDGISVHPYNYRINGNQGPELYARWMQRTHDRLLKLSGKSKLDFYVTEIGWPTNEGQWGRSEQQVALLASKTLLISSQLPFVKGLWWYDLKDDGSDSKNKEHRFGLFHSDNTSKPTVKAIESIIPRVE